MKVCSTSINDWDWGYVRGKPFIICLFFGQRKPKAIIPDVDISGTIETVVDNVSSLNIGDHFISVITDEKPDSEKVNTHFLNGHIDQDFLKQHIDDFNQSFYVCGPVPFNDAMIDHLKELGAEPDSMVFEE